MILTIFYELDLYPKSLLEDAFPKSLVTKYYGRNVVFSNGEVSIVS
jgi:hypothetical protein